VVHCFPTLADLGVGWGPGGKAGETEAMRSQVLSHKRACLSMSDLDVLVCINFFFGINCGLIKHLQK
jgi:hypothetical protein